MTKIMTIHVRAKNNKWLVNESASIKKITETSSTCNYQLVCCLGSAALFPLSCAPAQSRTEQIHIAQNFFGATQKEK